MLVVASRTSTAWASRSAKRGKNCDGARIREPLGSCCSLPDRPRLLRSCLRAYCILCLNNTQNAVRGKCRVVPFNGAFNGEGSDGGLRSQRQRLAASRSASFFTGRQPAPATSQRQIVLSYARPPHPRALSLSNGFNEGTWHRESPTRQRRLAPGLSRRNSLPFVSRICVPVFRQLEPLCSKAYLSKTLDIWQRYLLLLR